MRRGGGVYVAYITSGPGLDATFIQLRRKNKKNPALNTCLSGIGSDFGYKELKMVFLHTVLSFL